MHVHRSNRTEKLVDVLSEIVARPLADALTPEVVVVQGRGMERWLAMQLSRRLGVWANCTFPFPRHLVQQVLRASLGPEAVDPRFEPESLRWSIAAHLPQLLQLQEFDALRRYLETEQSSYRLLQLAERVATLFDQYVVYRPDLILRWEQNQESHWQACLWRALMAEHEPAHMAACARDFHAAVRQRQERPADVPARICLFGLSTLAPLYLQIFDALSQWSDVHLILLSPSREYWAQIRSQRQILRRQPPARPADDLEALLRQEAGNPLLASLGRLGRELQEVLESNVEYEEDDSDLYVEPPPQTMLQVIQGDMLALRYRGASADAPRLALH
jgi:exodeoxyribonuclease V gamma subunit